MTEQGSCLHNSPLLLSASSSLVHELAHSFWTHTDGASWKASCGKQHCPGSTDKGLRTGKGQPKTWFPTSTLALNPNLALRKSLQVTVPCLPHLWKYSSTDGHSREKGRGKVLGIQAGKKPLLNKKTMRTIKAKSCSWRCWNDPRDCPSVQKGELGHW